MHEWSVPEPGRPYHGVVFRGVAAGECHRPPGRAPAQGRRRIPWRRANRRGLGLITWSGRPGVFLAASPQSPGPAAARLPISRCHGPAAATGSPGSAGRPGVHAVGRREFLGDLAPGVGGADYRDLSRRESLRVPVVGAVKLLGAWHLDSSMAWIKTVPAAGRRWTPATLRSRQCRGRPATRGGDGNQLGVLDLCRSGDGPWPAFRCLHIISTASAPGLHVGLARLSS